MNCAGVVCPPCGVSRLHLLLLLLSLPPTSVTDVRRTTAPLASTWISSWATATELPDLIRAQHRSQVPPLLLLHCPRRHVLPSMSPAAMATHKLVELRPRLLFMSDQMSEDLQDRPRCVVVKPDAQRVLACFRHLLAVRISVQQKLDLSKKSHHFYLETLTGHAPDEVSQPIPPPKKSSARSFCNFVSGTREKLLPDRCGRMKSQGCGSSSSHRIHPSSNHGGSLTQHKVYTTQSPAVSRTGLERMMKRSRAHCGGLGHPQQRRTSRW